MARINFEDNVESKDEFWALIKLVGGDRDVALGRLIRFFRLAQEAYGYDCPMTEADLRDKGFGCMIESRWAVPVPGGYQSMGAEEHFSWYRQKIAAGSKGGKARTKKHENPPPPSLPPAEAADSVATATLPPAKPLTLSPSLSLSKEKQIYTREHVIEACAAWGQTLRRYRIEKDPKWDEATIVRLIANYGFDKTKTALLGAGFETKTEKYDPAKHCRISRLLKPDIFELCVNLGAQQTQPEWRAASDAVPKG